MRKYTPGGIDRWPRVSCLLVVPLAAAFDPAVEVGLGQQLVELAIERMPRRAGQTLGRDKQSLLLPLPLAHRHRSTSLSTTSSKRQYNTTPVKHAGSGILQRAARAASYALDPTNRGYYGPDARISVPWPAPNPFAISPLFSRATDGRLDVEDFATAQASDYSFAFNASQVRMSASAESSATLSYGVEVSGGAHSTFNVIDFNVDQPTPFTVTATLSATRISSQYASDSGAVFSRLLIRNIYGVPLADHRVTFGTEVFSDSGILMPGIAYYIYSEIEASSHLWSSLREHFRVQPARVVKCKRELN